MRLPTVSVIVPTYNRAAFVIEAVKSVFAQTRIPDEIIIIDDGSTDETRTAIQGHFQSRVRYVWQPNQGPAAARNRGLELARGDAVSFLDSDDLWHPEKTAIQLGFLENNPDVDCVFADMSNFTAAPDFCCPEIKSPDLHNYIVAHSCNIVGFMDCLIRENIVPTPTVMLSRRAISMTGRFDETMRVVEDLDYWLRAAMRLRWGFVDKVLVARRRHPDNLIADWPRLNLALLNVLQLTAKRVDGHQEQTRLLLQRKIRSLNYDLGSTFLKQRRFALAQRHLRNARNGSDQRLKLEFKIILAILLRLFARDARV